MSERPTPQRCVEAYYRQRTRFERIAERKLRQTQLTDDGNVEISGRDLREAADSRRGSFSPTGTRVNKIRLALLFSDGAFRMRQSLARNEMTYRISYEDGLASRRDGSSAPSISGPNSKRRSGAAVLESGDHHRGHARCLGQRSHRLPAGAEARDAGNGLGRAVN